MSLDFDEFEIETDLKIRLIDFFIDFRSWRAWWTIPLSVSFLEWVLVNVCVS